ncbi:hypothetical protein Q3G72_031727 [Acer saccharum]|nr:hypothetical protein Q3G72_031727 [Acer saccharum]
MQSNTVSVIDEPSRVLEVGTALGLDYGGKEQELEVVIATREEEDVLRLLEHQGYIMFYLFTLACDFGFKGVGSAVRWSSSAGPAQPTSANRPVVYRWWCAGRPAQATSAHEKWSMRWWCAGHPAQADQRTTHNQVRFFKTTSLY